MSNVLLADIPRIVNLVQLHEDFEDLMNKCQLTTTPSKRINERLEGEEQKAVSVQVFLWGEGGGTH